MMSNAGRLGFHNPRETRVRFKSLKYCHCNEIIPLFIYNLNLCYYNGAMKTKIYAVEAPGNKIYIPITKNHRKISAIKILPERI